MRTKFLYCTGIDLAFIWSRLWQIKIFIVIRRPMTKKTKNYIKINKEIKIIHNTQEHKNMRNIEIKWQGIRHKSTTLIMTLKENSNEINYRLEWLNIKIQF